MMISSDYAYQYISPARSRPPVDASFEVGESPLRVASAAATDIVEISGSETPYPYAMIYGPPTAIQEIGAPVVRLGIASAEEDEDGVAAEASAGEGEAREAEAATGEETANGQELSEDEQRQIRELEQRDQEVRQHEQAHKSVGGQYAGAMSFEYQQGPDGQRYAVGGEVSIDISKERDADATAAKMRQVRAAALAPANPSAQDLSVAAEASQLEAEARQEASEQRITGANGGEGEGGVDEAGRSGTQASGESGDEAESETAGMGQVAEPGAAMASEVAQSADAVRDDVQDAGAASIAASVTASLSSPYANNFPASLFTAAQYGPAGGMLRSRIDIVA